MTPHAGTDDNRHTTNGTRLFAGIALALVASGVAWASREIYHAATDSFVAPIILGPDNDAVISAKLGFTQLEVEHARCGAEIQSIDSDLEAAAHAVARLRELSATVEGSLGWLRAQNRRSADKGSGELKALEDQAALLDRMIAEQDKVTASAKANLAAGLISESDFARERLALSQLRVARLENNRSRIDGAAQAREVQLAHDTLERGGRGVALPEQIVREDQRVRIDLEVLKLESERRSKTVERKLLEEKRARIEELEAQLKARPLLRAAEHKLEVAFVPYTQIEGVHAGSAVYSCVWGLFHCHRAGTIAEVVAGEVILPDPWGNQARGQYAILDLADHEAALDKTLRVRSR